ncbi:MAG: TldD/PmbA family protein [Candidatus Methanofastidiosia archaeon]|jgi:PmbA protein
MVKKTMDMGAAECEVCIEDTTETIITLDRKFISGKREKKFTTFGIRTLLNNKKGFVAGSLPIELYEPEKISLKIAKASVPDTQWKHLPYPRPATSVTGIYSKKLAEMPFENLKDDMVTLIKTGDNPGITLDSGRLSRVVKTFSICNSHGLSHQYTSTMLNVHFVVRCKTSESTWGVHHSRGYDCDFFELAAKTVEQAKAMKTPEKLHSSFTGDAIFLGEPVEDILLTPLRYCFNAQTVKKTRFHRMLHEKVVSESITMVDDGTIDNGVNTFPIDGEGNPTEKTPLITKGIFSHLLHSEYTANVQGVQSTGNGIRSAVTEPGVRITNLILEKGVTSTEELVQQVKKGVIMGDFSGNVDPFTGLFSGVMEHTFYIEKGEILYPVTGVMIRGNIFDLLNNVISVGKEVRTGETGMYTVPVLTGPVDIIV